MNDAVLNLIEIHKQFGQNPIIKGLSIDIYKGEFITLLGESGCGKTTTLRLVAGLETLDKGQILLDGRDVGGLPPDKRNVNTVFQNYALFPHMNVFDNISYGPRNRGVSKHEIKNGVHEMLDLVKMTGYEKRLPNQLSGGQRQRVAIARALINKPLILLLDEPLGALDQKLRQHMQSELKSIQTRAGVTFVYVTHDQDEALNMSDRICVMRDGQFAQIGTPREIYEEPADLFVADFVGERNILNVHVIGREGGYSVVSLGKHRLLTKKNITKGTNEPAYAAALSDKAVLIRDGAERVNTIPAKVVNASYTGSRVVTHVMIDDTVPFSVVEYGGASIIPAGSEVYISVRPEDIILLSDTVSSTEGTKGRANIGVD